MPTLLVDEALIGGCLSLGVFLVFDLPLGDFDLGVFAFAFFGVGAERFFGAGEESDSESSSSSESDSPRGSDVEVFE